MSMSCDGLNCPLRPNFSSSSWCTPVWLKGRKQSRTNFFNFSSSDSVYFFSFFWYDLRRLTECEKYSSSSSSSRSLAPSSSSFYSPPPPSCTIFFFFLDLHMHSHILCRTDTCACTTIRVRLSTSCGHNLTSKHSWSPGPVPKHFNTKLK